MATNKYDRFLKNEFMPDVAQVLRREDTRLRKMIGWSDYSNFYKENNQGITSYAVTERIYQYLIFRSLAGDYRMILEDFSYPNDASRIDISIFKSRPKKDQKYADIGIEIKLAKLTNDGVFTPKSISDFKKDFVKIKKVKHENKYLLQIVEATNLRKVNEDSLELQIWLSLGKQGIRTYKPNLIFFYKFKTTKTEDESSQMLLLLWKIEDQRI